MAILKPGQLASESYTISGSFSGSFQGSGAGLNNIPSSAIVGLGSTQIASGAVSASVSTGTGSFTVTSGSSTFMFISSSGNIGLGTTTPSRLLHVSEGGTRLSQTFNPGVPTLYVYHGRTETDSTVRFENASGDQLYFGGNGLFVTGNTTIGNGSTTLSARLGVKGSGTTSATTSLLVQNSAAIPSLQLTDDGNIKFFDTNTAVASTSYASFIPKYSTNNMALGFYEGSSPGVLRLVIYRDGSNTVYLTTGGGNVFTASPSAATIPGTLNANNTLYVTGSRVGIGTSTPSQSLDISGNINALNSSNAGLDMLTLRNTSTGNTNQTRIRFYNDSGATPGNGGVIFLTGNNYSGFPTNSFGLWNESSNGVIALATNNTERLRLFLNGNLAINTTTDAGYKLDVNGTARIGNGSPTSTFQRDFVLAKTQAAYITAFSVFNGSTTGYTGFYIGEDNSNLAFNFKYGSAVTGNWLGTSLPIANSYQIATGGTNNLPLILQGTPIVFAPGITSTNIGVRHDATCFKIGTLADVHTSGNASAAVQIDSTTKGFLPPRMTGAQAELISSPAEGLMVYATAGTGVTITSKGWWGYDGATWVKFN